MPPLHNWYDVLKDLVIPMVSSLLSFTALIIAIRSFRDNTRIARANFELQMTLSHRDTWRNISALGLERIKQTDADPQTITEAESTNINFVLHNVKNRFDVMQKGLITDELDKLILMKDIGEFFSLPLPNEVWNKLKAYHHHEFVEFMANARRVWLGEPLPPKGWKKLILQMRTRAIQFWGCLVKRWRNIYHATSRILTSLQHWVLRGLSELRTMFNTTIENHET